jgi:hypothetical protein
MSWTAHCGRPAAGPARWDRHKPAACRGVGAKPAAQAFEPAALQHARPASLCLVLAENGPS